MRATHGTEFGTELSLTGVIVCASDDPAGTNLKQPFACCVVSLLAVGVDQLISDEQVDDAGGYFGSTEEAIDLVRQNAILKWKAR